MKAFLEICHSIACSTRNVTFTAAYQMKETACLLMQQLAIRTCSLYRIFSETRTSSLSLSLKRIVDELSWKEGVSSAEWLS